MSLPPIGHGLAALPQLQGRLQQFQRHETPLLQAYLTLDLPLARSLKSGMPSVPALIHKIGIAAEIYAGRIDVARNQTQTTIAKRSFIEFISFVDENENTLSGMSDDLFKSLIGQGLGSLRSGATLVEKRGKDNITYLKDSTIIVIARSGGEALTSFISALDRYMDFLPLAIGIGTISDISMKRDRDARFGIIDDAIKQGEKSLNSLGKLLSSSNVDPIQFRSFYSKVSSGAQLSYESIAVLYGNTRREEFVSILDDIKKLKKISALTPLVEAVEAWLIGAGELKFTFKEKTSTLKPIEACYRVGVFAKNIRLAKKISGALLERMVGEMYEGALKRAFELFSIREKNERFVISDTQLFQIAEREIDTRKAARTILAATKGVSLAKLGIGVTKVVTNLLKARNVAEFMDELCVASRDSVGLAGSAMVLIRREGSPTFIGQAEIEKVLSEGIAHEQTSPLANRLRGYLSSMAGGDVDSSTVQRNNSPAKLFFKLEVLLKNLETLPLISKKLMSRLEGIGVDQLQNALVLIKRRGAPFAASWEKTLTDEGIIDIARYSSENIKRLTWAMKVLSMFPELEAKSPRAIVKKFGELDIYLAQLFLEKRGVPIDATLEALRLETPYKVARAIKWSKSAIPEEVQFFNQLPDRLRPSFAEAKRLAALTEDKEARIRFLKKFIAGSPAEVRCAIQLAVRDDFKKEYKAAVAYFKRFVALLRQDSNYINESGETHSSGEELFPVFFEMALAGYVADFKPQDIIDYIHNTSEIKFRGFFSVGDAIYCLCKGITPEKFAETMTNCRALLKGEELPNRLLADITSLGEDVERVIGDGVGRVDTLLKSLRLLPSSVKVKEKIILHLQILGSGYTYPEVEDMILSGRSFGVRLSPRDVMNLTYFGITIEEWVKMLEARKEAPDQFPSSDILFMTRLFHLKLGSIDF